MSEYFTVFISYGTPDEVFATRLVDALNARGVQTWFFPRNKVPGQRLHVAMREGVIGHDRVIAICSKTSFKRRGFLNELEQCFIREADEGGSSILLPVAVDESLFSGGVQMEGGRLRDLLSRIGADFRRMAEDPTLFDREVASILSALRRPPVLVIDSGAVQGPALPVVAIPTAGTSPILATVAATGMPRASPLIIEYEAGADAYLMRWDRQIRVIKGNEFSYTHRVFRVRVRNTSQITVRGVQVVISNVIGLAARHSSVLPEHRLRVMDASQSTAEANINPGAWAYFDVASHDLEPDLHAIDDLKFRYADVEKESLPTDPGTWWNFTLQAQGIDVPPTEAHFRLLVDADNLAQLKPIAPPQRSGIEPSFERRIPFEDDDYVDTEFGEGGRIFRIGLRSREPNTAYTASVAIEGTDGGIEGARLERLLWFKDTGLGTGRVGYDRRACAFVDVLKFPTLGNQQPQLLYAEPPQVADHVGLTSRFSLRLRISGGPNTAYLTLTFVPDILGFPVVRTYEVE